MTDTLTGLILSTLIAIAQAILPTPTPTPTNEESITNPTSPDSISPKSKANK